MTAYYNEFDPFMAQWLRNLIAAGHIAPGIVDDRSITDVRASDLNGFTQCHFFAGLGGWSYALRLACVPDDFPCWTGSPPCQPFSVAGAGRGKDDSRHLAPAFLDLLSECRPATLFGEQVANAVKKDNWADALFLELAEEGYASGFAVLPACSVGAPHKRDRIFFAAYRLARTGGAEWNGERLHGLAESDYAQACGTPAEFTGCCNSCRMADTVCQGLQRRCGEYADCGQEGREKQIRHYRARCVVGGMADTKGDGWGVFDSANVGAPDASCHSYTDASDCSIDGQKRFAALGQSNKDNSFWADADWLSCRDGWFRAVESESFPLVDGIPKGLGRGKHSPAALASGNRKGRLKGYGNAIVPQVAAEFIKAFMECMPND